MAESLAQYLKEKKWPSWDFVPSLLNSKDCELSKELSFKCLGVGLWWDTEWISWNYKLWLLSRMRRKI